MKKQISFAAFALLILSLATIDAKAILTSDKQAVIEELDAYGIEVSDHYPSREPTTSDDYYKLGVAYLFRNMPRAASEQFRRALELDAEHVDSLIGLAASIAQTGDIEEAIKYSLKAIKTEPNNAKAHNLVGALRLASAASLRDLEEAESRFTRAISLDSGFVSPHMNLARLYVSMKKPTAAVKEYEAAIKVQPRNLLAHAELARAHLYAGSLDKATEQAEKAVELSPQNPVSHNILGEMYSRKNQYDKALEEFQKAVELEPTYAIGYKNIGHIYILKGLMNKAIEEYQKALSYRPNYGEAYSGLADAYLSKGMTQEAIEGYRNAIRVLPVSAVVSVSAYNNLAYVYAEMEEDLDEALSLVLKAKQLAPEHPDIADTIGWIYYKKEVYDEAVVNLKAAVEGSPDNPIIRYHLGAAYYMQDVRDQAIAELQKALEISDQFDGIEHAKRMLAELGY